jgi:hypothetical protein
VSTEVNHTLRVDRKIPFVSQSDPRNTAEAPETDSLTAALVFVERYGLDGTPPRSLADVAERYALTRLDVRRLESRVLAILRAAFEAKSAR